MPVNAYRPDRWKTDIAHSVDFYNEWFLRFAPQAFRTSRIEATDQVVQALAKTDNLRNLTLEVLRKDPGILGMLRMVTAPPIARDRMIGLAGVPRSLVQTMESQRQLPPRMSEADVTANLAKMCRVVISLIDEDLFSWLGSQNVPTDLEIRRAASVVADRLCGVLADPIVRNAQERRQLEAIQHWLSVNGYRLLSTDERTSIASMTPGTFAFRVNVRVHDQGRSQQLNIPVDAVVMPLMAKQGELPLLIEAKSAGDFTNPNKRWKEEATKIKKLRESYGNVTYILFLNGYFNLMYLAHGATEGIDWIWEHRIDDLAELGL